jgi:hypothetical protein
MLRVEGWRVAVVMACGPDAVLSHECAAEYWGMRPHNGTVWTVSVPRHRGGSIRGIRTHRMKLDPADLVFVDGIWVTTPARTLIDLAEVVPFGQLPRAIERLEELRLFDLRAIEAAMARSPGRRGLRPLAAALELHRPGVVTRPGWSGGRWSSSPPPGCPRRPPTPGSPGSTARSTCSGPTTRSWSRSTARGTTAPPARSSATGASRPS